MSECSDCHSNSQELHEVAACSDYHVNGMSCCFKQVCADFCTFSCSSCSAANKIYLEDSVDNFYEAFECWKCATINDVKVVYWGDVKESCRRYCESCTLHTTDKVVVKGKE